MSRPPPPSATIRVKLALAVALVTVVASGCTPGADRAREEAAARSTSEDLVGTLEPTDEAAPEPEPSPATEDEGPAEPDPPPDEPADTSDREPAADDRDTEDPPAEPEPVVPDEPSPPERSSVTDPRGDVRQPLIGSAPEWADLVGGSVESGPDVVTVTIELAEAPTTPASGTTLNLASFHDLTGDGYFDLEVWANYSDAGWYPSWRDNRAGEAAFGERSGVGVRGEAATVTWTIPAERFGGADQWRWVLGLEWGRYEWLGTSAAARDRAPDEGAVQHPA